MNKIARVTLAALSAGAVFAFGLRYAASRATADSRFKESAAHRVFDPSRDASSDLRAALEQARNQHKNVLMDVGGNWCPSCILLDQTLKSDSDLQARLKQDYILLHVKWSSDNRNKTVLNKYPEAHGYPALYVIAADGRLIKAENKAENTDEFSESAGQGSTYSRDAIAAFLTRYAPRS